MKTPYWLRLTTLVILVAITIALLPTAGYARQTTQTLPEDTPERFVVRVYYDDPADLTQLSSFDLFEYNNKKEQYVLVGVDRFDHAVLQSLGWRVELDIKETAAFNRRPPVHPEQLSGIPGYPCYRTVEETFATAQSIVAAYPDLASWIDAGDSWEKSEPGGLDGYDMMVLKLSNANVPGPKPKLFITTSIHAREYTPAELNTRFAEYLVANYNIDPDVTWVLDYHEIHLMLQANPDGRKHAEAAQSWRKNTNQNYCSPTSNNRGADLNRNFEFQWGCCGGSSGSQCDLTYRGPSSASEPETQAIQTYMRSIFPDQRGDPLNDPAPDDATGVYLDIHSYSELVLWPWGFTSTVAPNGTALQTLGRRFAYFNGYYPEQAIGLYPTDGTTDDFGYGDLGVPSYTFELGTAFFQSCSAFENTILPDNLPALLYAARVARTPYLTPAGPDALNVTPSPGTIYIGEAATLTATIDDTRFNNGNGTEPTQNIVAAQYYVDVPPWEPSATGYPMTAVDGSFNSTVEDVTTDLDTTGLTPGRHIIFVRGQDSAANWGPVSAAFVEVKLFSANPTTQAVCSPADASFTLNVGGSDPVTLSASGNPAGTTADFSVNPVSPPGSSILTIGNTGSAAPGSYAIDVTGVSASATQTTTLHLDLYDGSPGVPTLISPADGAVNVSVTPAFTWNPVAQAATYSIEIATDSAFNMVVDSASGLSNTSYTPAVALNTGTRYFWRVWADNTCGPGTYSPVYNFITVAAPGDCGPGSVASLLLSEGFEAGGTGWTSGGSGNTWALSTARPHTGSYAFHGDDVTSISDQYLVSPAVSLPVGQSPLSLKFWNYQEMEDRSGGCYDGGVIEVSSDGGATWIRLESELLTDLYDGPIYSGSGNPLGGQNAWCGDPQDWLNSIVDIDAFAGETVQFRWRLATDSSVGREGWHVDDVVVQACEVPCAYDVDSSGHVDIADIQLVAGFWGSPHPIYDFNGSGTVDVDDIQAVANWWNTICID
ncbi:MAG: M14 family zinc carboxypeptidase [Chloroflexota bacterium]|nr:M14 family zinc carboxypeptidase [Chloroflexota bacterium]